MFNRIARVSEYIRDFRIKMDFPQFEKKCRLDHEQRTERLFSTTQLEMESATLTSKIQCSADEIFDKRIIELNSTITKLESEIHNNEIMLSYFTRNYGNELDTLYAKKNELNSEKNDAYAHTKELNNQIDHIIPIRNNYQEKFNEQDKNVRDWYRKSERTPWLFGNGGNEIPEHSMFGQSHGDLEEYKRKRNAASNEIEKYKIEIRELKNKINANTDHITTIKQEIEIINLNIVKTKADKLHLNVLRTNGSSRDNLEKIIANLNETLNHERLNLNAQKSGLIDYIEIEKHRYGVIDRENEITEIKEKKAKYLNSFDLQENHNQRLMEHRIKWLKERNFA